MPAPTIDPITSQLIHTLNHCIKICMDGENGYAAAASEVDDLRLRELFQGYSEERAEFLRDLRLLVEKYGGSAVAHGTLRGAAHRGFMNVRTKVEPEKATAILGECERGELRAISTYDRALAETYLDTWAPDARALLLEQKTAMTAAYAALTEEDLTRRRTALRR